MSESGAVAAHEAHAVPHEELGFIRTYIFSTDHKMIGRQFLFMSLIMLVFGGLMAMMMRWELAWPESELPFTKWIPEPYMYEGHMDPAFYNSLFTMHAPLMIGAGDMAFPTLNMISFWTAVPAFFLIMSSFFVPGGAAAGGWTMYATL